MGKMYEFDARVSKVTNIYDERVPCYFGLMFCNDNHFPITGANPNEVFAKNNYIGMITQISLNSTGICYGREMYTFRLELDDSNPMGKFADYIIDLLYGSNICKTGETGISNYMTIAGQVQNNMHDYVLFADFIGFTPPQVLEDYYEIIFTNKYTERYKKYIEENK